MSTAGLKTEFNRDSTANPRLAAAWGIASKWTEASRYELWNNVSAGSLLSAITDPEDGVFQWLKARW